MEADLTRLPTGTAGWCALVDHAVSLGDLSEVTYLELKGTLPFTGRSDRKRPAVTVARAVLGMANRMPDLAERHLGGHGLVLVGIDSRQVVGAEKVDGAILHDSLEPYVGDDGPSWDYVYVDHPDGLVLAIVVNPPRWGDRIHACRKEYSAEDGSLTVRDGDVFVRMPGKTRPATSSDLADLERRRDRSPSTGAQIRLEYGGTFDRVDSESVLGLVRSVIDERTTTLLSQVEDKVANNPYGIKMPSFEVRESRSPGRYRHSVEMWHERAYAKAADVTTEFLRHQLARGRWMIHNDSDRYLEAVRVQLEFPSGVAALIKSDTEYCDHGGSFDFLALLPKEPKTSKESLSIPLGPARPAYRAQSFVRDVDVVTDPATGKTQVTWEVGDLRPGSTEIAGELFAIVTDDHVSEISVPWRVTARGINYVFEGQAMLACAQAKHEHLGWSPRHAGERPA